MEARLIPGSFAGFLTLDTEQSLIKNSEILITRFRTFVPADVRSRVAEFQTSSVSPTRPSQGRERPADECAGSMSRRRESIERWDNDGIPSPTSPPPTVYAPRRSRSPPAPLGSRPYSAVCESNSRHATVTLQRSMKSFTIMTMPIHYRLISLNILMTKFASMESRTCCSGASCHAPPGCNPSAGGTELS